MSTPILKRKGMRWTDEETEQLLNEIHAKKTIKDIAGAHDRMTTSIMSKLTELAADYHFFDGRPTEEIIKLTGLTHKQIVNAVERRKAKNLLTNKKGIEPAPPEMSITPEPSEPVLVLSVPIPNEPSLTEIMEVLKDIQKKVAVLEKVRLRLETAA